MARKLRKLRLGPMAREDVRAWLGSVRERIEDALAQTVEVAGAEPAKPIVGQIQYYRNQISAIKQLESLILQLPLAKARDAIGGDQ